MVMFHDPGESLLISLDSSMGLSWLRALAGLFPSVEIIANTFCILALNRTTDSTGMFTLRNISISPQERASYLLVPPGEIKERLWYGPSGMQYVRTIKEPKQSIPTFEETIGLLMRVCISSTYH